MNHCHAQACWRVGDGGGGGPTAPTVPIPSGSSLLVGWPRSTSAVRGSAPPAKSLPGNAGPGSAARTGMASAPPTKSEPTGMSCRIGLVVSVCVGILRKLQTMAGEVWLGGIASAIPDLHRTRSVRIALRSALRGSSGWLRPRRLPSIRTGPAHDTGRAPSSPGALVGAAGPGWRRRRKLSGVSRRRGNRGGGQRGCILVCEQPCDRKVERGMVRRQSVEHPRSRRCGHADAAEGNVHGLEVLTMGLIDVAVAALPRRGAAALRRGPRRRGHRTRRPGRRVPPGRLPAAPSGAPGRHGRAASS